MNPVQHPDAFETVTIAGVTWSGTATITGLDYAAGWDVQEADGASGATATLKSTRKLSQPSIRFDIIFDPILQIDQFTEWYETWVPLLRSCIDGATPVGLTIEHPDAQALDVASVLVQTIGQVDRDPTDYGHATVDVSLIQYAPPKPAPTKSAAKSKGKSPGAASGSSDGPDPNDPITKRTNELTELLDGP